MFGKVSVQDLSTAYYKIDSTAGAVVIADIGSSEFLGNDDGGFTLRYQRYFRIHILKNEGYRAANLEIPLYVSKDSKETIKDLNAITYNLENGSVTTTKLDTKKSVFTEKLDKNHVVVKFTLPAVKAGSVIECKYTINSDFIFNLQPWSFQGEFPRLWSEYNVALPQFYNYVALTQGNQQYYIKSETQSIRNFDVSQPKESTYGDLGTTRFTISASVTNVRWAMKDVPGLTEEPFTSSVNNHFSRIEFQLSETRSPMVQRTIMSTWPEASKTLLQHDKFGAELAQDNTWLRETVNKAAIQKESNSGKIQKIFAWVRDQFNCTQQNGLLQTQSMRALVKNKSGNTADINLLLVAMLREAGISADPVILSLRSNGYAHNVYPLIDRYNYVICRAVVDDRIYFLDASDARIGFNRLPAACYNGHARIVNETSPAVFFEADSLKEVKSTTVFIINEGKATISGTLVQTPGYYESAQIRNTIIKEGKESFINSLKKDFDAALRLKDSKIDSLNALDDPLQISIDFESMLNGEAVVYFDPMLGQGYKQNPFKSAKRQYPVEMPFTIDRTYQMEMEVPEGYTVDELPRPVLVKLNEKEDGIFEYRMSQSGGRISFRTRLKISRAFFIPEEYQLLREFFNQVVKKQAEQIVFKKKP